MKRTQLVPAVAGALLLAGAAGAADAPSSTRADRPQAAAFGAPASPASILLTACLVLTGAGVIALGAWSGDSAETP